MKDRQKEIVKKGKDFFFFNSIQHTQHDALHLSDTIFDTMEEESLGTLYGFFCRPNKHSQLPQIPTCLKVNRAFSGFFTMLVTSLLSPATRMMMLGSVIAEIIQHN